jgi:hypothetical protein
MGAVAVLAAALFVGIWIIFDRSGDQVVPKAVGTEPSNHILVAGSVRKEHGLPPRYGLIPGLYLLYEASYDQDLRVRMSADVTNETVAAMAQRQDDGAALASMAIKANLRVDVLSEDGENVWCIGRLIDLDFGGCHSTLFGLEELRYSTLFLLAPDGEILKCHPVNEMPKQVVRLWQCLLPILFLQLPDEGRQEWDHSYSDTLGTYAAHHEFAAPAQVKVTKKEYTKTNGGPGGSSSFTVSGLRHDHIFTFAPHDAWVARSVLSEDVSIGILGGHGGSMSAHRSATLELTASGHADINETMARVSFEFGGGQLADIVSRGRSYRVDEWIAPEVGAQPKKLPVAVDQFLEAYSALGGERPHERNRLFRGLVDTLRRDDEAIAQLQAAIGVPGIDGGLQNWLIHALGSAGTPAAQELLVTLIESDSRRLAEASVLASSNVKQPTSALVQAILAITLSGQEPDASIRHKAISVAGAFISRLEGASDDWHRVVGTLEAVTANSHSDALTRASLTAWSNSRLPDSTRRILEAVEARSSESTWLGAIFALENVPVGDARDALLALTEPGQASDSIRDRAVRALAKQKLPADRRVTEVVAQAVSSANSRWITVETGLKYLGSAAAHGDLLARRQLQVLASSLENEKARLLARRLIASP